MKPLVIYHANCADGFGAAFAAWLKLGDGEWRDDRRVTVFKKKGKAIPL